MTTQGSTSQIPPIANASKLGGNIDGYEGNIMRSQNSKRFLNISESSNPGAIGGMDARSGHSSGPQGHVRGGRVLLPQGSTSSQQVALPNGQVQVQQPMVINSKSNGNLMAQQHPMPY